MGTCREVKGMLQVWFMDGLAQGMCPTAYRLEVGSGAIHARHTYSTCRHATDTGLPTGRGGSRAYLECGNAWELGKRLE